MSTDPDVCFFCGGAATHVHFGEGQCCGCHCDNRGAHACWNCERVSASDFCDKCGVQICSGCEVHS